MIKITDIEDLLLNDSEITHIIYGIPVENMQEIKRVVGGEIIDLPFQKSKYTFKKTHGNVELIIHSATKIEFQLSRI